MNESKSPTFATKTIFAKLSSSFSCTLTVENTCTSHPADLVIEELINSAWSLDIEDYEKMGCKVTQQANNHIWIWAKQ